MITGKTAFVLFFLLMLLQAALIFALPEGMMEKDPAWVYYEKGKYEMSKNDYGDAIFYFQQALAAAQIMPEAELAIGDAYAAKSDYAIAEQQYKSALEHKAAFQVPDYYYTVLYRLAALYKKWLKYHDMYQVLNRIIDEDESFKTDSKFLKSVRDNMLKLFRNKGFDRMFLYNRLDDTFSTQAHGELAWYLYKTWRFEAAQIHALYSVIPVISEGMREIRKDIYDYRYTTLQDFFATAMTIDRVRAYLAQKDIYERLYYLSLVSYEIVPYRNQGRALQKILAGLPEAGMYRKLAARQLVKPEREAGIDIRKIEK